MTSRARLKIAMVNILVINKYYLNLIGILPVHTSHEFNFSTISILLRIILISSLLLLHFAPTTYYFCANITSLTKSTASFYVIGVLAIFISAYWNIVAHRKCVNELLNNLEGMLLWSNYADLLKVCKMKENGLYISRLELG